MKTTLERIWERCPHAPTKSTEFKTLIPALKEFVPWTESNPELFFAIVNSIQEKPVCQFCGKPKTFYNINIGYSNTCGSKSCAAKFSFEVHPELKVVHATNNIGKKLSDSTKEKLRQKAKIINSNPSKIERTRQAVQQKYGVDNVFQLSSVKEKSKTTCLKKYGVEYNSQRVEIKEGNSQWMLGMKRLLLEKYGVEYCMHVPEFFTKAQKNSKVSKYKTKIFTFPSGNSVVIQGYEDKAILQLLNEGFSEEDMIFDNSLKPVIKYTFKTYSKRYYCDIWIPSKNMVVEVKSDYTWNNQLDLNLKKIEATVSSGFNFRLIKFQ